MSRAGHLALQRLIIDYSAIGPAHGLRHAFAREIPHFKREFPSVTVEVRPRAKAAAITAVYRDGSEKAFYVNNMSSQAIYLKLHDLAQDCNDRTVPFNSQFMHYQQRSVQGAWSPYLWMAERHEERVPEPKWDRKLSEPEWDYYVDKYSERMRQDRTAVQRELGKREELPRQITEELAERWKKFAAPHLQTDMEHNLGLINKQAAVEGKAPPQATWDEYRLFAAPDIEQSGMDVLQGLRQKEMAKTERWWQRRKDQLKPPK